MFYVSAEATFHPKYHIFGDFVGYLNDEFPLLCRIRGRYVVKGSEQQSIE